MSVINHEQRREEAAQKLAIARATAAIPQIFGTNIDLDTEVEKNVQLAKLYEDSYHAIRALLNPKKALHR